MVKEIKAWKNEITGEIFESIDTAKESEEKAKQLTEENEIKNFANDLAKRYGYTSWTGLIFYLNNNIDKIKNAGVKIRVIELQKKTCKLSSKRSTKSFRFHCYKSIS